MKKDPRVAELVGIIGRDRARVDLIEKAIADLIVTPNTPQLTSYVSRRPKPRRRRSRGS